MTAALCTSPLAVTIHEVDQSGLLGTVRLSKGKTDQVLALGTRTSTRGRGGTVLVLLSLATTTVLLLGMMASISVALIVGAIIAVWLLCVSALLRRADATAG
ncbi:MAG: hypothetical protein ACRDPZ_02065, partial [Gaiellaceae bacterium]